MKRSSDFFLELTSAIRTSPPVVTVVGIGSLAILVIKVVWLNYLPPVFPRADAAGSIVEGLLGATFAAWIFFVISYQIPQVMERKRVGASIVRLGRETASMVMSVYIKMLPGSDRNIDPKAVTLADVKSLFGRTNSQAESEITNASGMRRLPWLPAMVECRDRFCAIADQIWRYSRFIDPELAALIDGLEFSEFSTEMKTMRDFGHGAFLAAEQTLEAWADCYFKCFQMARELEKYCDGFSKTYGL